jgi:hypothetical protein
MNEWPNWSLALPAPLEELEQAALPRAVAAALRIRDSAPERQPCVPDNSGRDSAAP